MCTACTISAGGRAPPPSAQDSWQPVRTVVHCWACLNLPTSQLLLSKQTAPARPYLCTTAPVAAQAWWTADQVLLLPNEAFAVFCSRGAERSEISSMGRGNTEVRAAHQNANPPVHQGVRAFTEGFYTPCVHHKAQGIHSSSACQVARRTWTISLSFRRSFW